MKADKKRPDGEKKNREKYNREKLGHEKLNYEKMNQEKMNQEKKDAVMPGREKMDSAGTSVNVHDGEDEESAPKESGLAMDAAGAGGTGEADNAAGAGSTGETDNAAGAGGTGEADNAAGAGGTEEADNAAGAGGTGEADNASEADSIEEAGSAENNSEKDNTASAESREPDDREDEGEDWENDDEQDDWEEEAEPSKPWVMALVFFGMVFAAACICVMLWVFTHPDKQEEGNRDVLAEATAAPGSGGILSPSETTPSATGSLPLDNQGGNAAPGSNSGETDTPASDLNRVTTRDGRVVIFTECDDMVTPKEYVNLRTEPSTSQGEATVGCRLNQGETAHRTGISEEMGWSRVEYNDQILYVVSSFVNVVTDGQTAE